MLIPYTVLISVALSAALLTAMMFHERDVKNNSIRYTGLLIEQVAGDLDSYITYMENISAMVANSRDVRKYLEEEYSQEEEQQLEQRILTQYSTVMEAREDISNIGIIRRDKGGWLINDGTDSINPNLDLEEVDWFSRAAENVGQFLTSSHVQNVVQNNYKWVVTLSRGVYGSDGSCIGVFFIDLNYRVIRDLCEKSNLGEGGYIYILDGQREMVYHPKQQLWYSGFLQEYISEVADSREEFVTRRTQNREQLYTKHFSEKTGWTVVGVVNTTALLKGASLAKRLYPLIFLSILTATVAVSVALSSAITGPLRRLIQGIKKVEKGDFDNPVPMEDAGHEFNTLAGSFNRMAARIRELMIQNTRQQEEKRISELQALQAQINPHFLYNTLDSIIWMAEDRQYEEVVKMTSSLAKLLRQSITNEEKKVTIGRELDYVDHYLTIQKMRYQDKLEYRIEAQEEIKKQTIVKLVLQPLVENAIYHGIKYIEGSGMIQIRACREGNRIRLEVQDNGAGMDKDTLAHIFEEKTLKKGSGVGIANVQKRLILEYGEESGLQYESSPGKGTKVTFSVPAECASGTDCGQRCGEEWSD